MVEYKLQSKLARIKVLGMVYRAQSSHIGSHFSIIDIFTVLFDSVDLSKDKVILSAGWKAAPFYYFLAQCGVIPEEDLDTYCQPNSKYIGLTEPGVPGVLFAGGSMQMGLSASIGFALAKKLNKEKGKVYCICSDGEIGGGMIWEALAIAHHHQLDNLVLVIDYNRLQAMGETNKILDMRPLREKIRAFGWNTVEVDGHDFGMLERAFFVAKTHPLPMAIIAHTTKGKGWKRAEDNNLYHYKNISYNEYIEALNELSDGISYKNYLPELP